MPDKSELLQSRFQLLDHPFDPRKDARAEPPYLFETASLRNALEIHEFQELRNYFVRVGPFATQAEKADRFFAKWTGAQGPPTVVAYGPTHGGLDSIASYAAALIRDVAPRKAVRFGKLKVAGGGTLSFLEQLNVTIRSHVRATNLKDQAADLFALADKKDVSEAVLTQMFTDLGDVLKNAPWLVLFIRPIEFKQRKLIHSKLELLTDMRVAPIFMTSDADVSNEFKGTNNPRTLHLHVDALNSSQGLELLERRLERFRQQPTTVPNPYFPYAAQDIKTIFAEGNLPIGFVLDRYYSSLEDKLNAEHAPGSEIDLTSISQSYDRELEEVAKARRS